MSAVTGIEHRNVGARGAAFTSVAGGAAAAKTAAPAATGRAPSVRIVIPDASNPATTVPSRSVRSTRAPAAASRSIVDLAGCPYGFPAPAEATATAGRTVSTNACVVAVLLP
jgi:hypothetical protein